jgi:hypothetical protein
MAVHALMFHAFNNFGNFLAAKGSPSAVNACHPLLISKAMILPLRCKVGLYKIPTDSGANHDSRFELLHLSWTSPSVNFSMYRS